MTIVQDEDLRLLRDSVGTLLDRAGGLGRARSLRDSDEPWDASIWQELAAAGVLGVAAPEEAGGLGMGLEAAGVVAQELGRVIAPEPVVATLGLAIGLMHRLCPQDDMLDGAIAGDVVLAVAWQERSATGLSDAIECRFDGATLNGSKDWVIGANGADQILVIAEGAQGPALVRVAADASGITTQARKQSDGSSLWGLSFASTPAEVLAEGAQVSDALADAVADTTALAASELIGLSGAALALTLEYIKTREQFDKPIGSFQAIQHRAVDMHVMQEVAEAAVREALAAMDQTGSAPERAQQASRAKARACSAAQKITREAIQLHGAVGYTDEFDVGLLLNRALVLSAWLGDAAYHRRCWLNAKETEVAAQ
ncbi:MAG: acyl-CoA dehydrogenase family protein [Roseovarius sp.]|nr:acyl-CoA dehydrogenase family protein [Roseovarius sp.]